MNLVVAGVSSMKAITVWQPWASLIAFGAKHFETRSWATGHRGLLAIHAGAALRLEHRALCAEEPFRSALRRGGILDANRLPLGKVVAIVSLIDCVRVGPGFTLFSEAERAFGDFTPGRYAWRLASPLPLVRPIPVPGHQGLWDWDPPPEFKDAVIAIAEKVRVALIAAGAERGSVP